MAKVKNYGCASVITALCLQFELAAHGLRCALRRTEKGQWVVEAQVRDYTRALPRTVTPPVGLCECNQGRTPCTCKVQGQCASLSIHGGA